MLKKGIVVAIGLAVSCRLNATGLDCTDVSVKPIDRIANYIISGSMHLAEELSCQRVRSERERQLSNDNSYVRDILPDIKFRSMLVSQASDSSLPTSTFETVGIEINRKSNGKDLKDDIKTPIGTLPGYISR